MEPDGHIEKPRPSPAWMFRHLLVFPSFQSEISGAVARNLFYQSLTALFAATYPDGGAFFYRVVVAATAYWSFVLMALLRCSPVTTSTVDRVLLTVGFVFYLVVLLFLKPLWGWLRPDNF
jgi:hypothetical protein